MKKIFLLPLLLISTLVGCNQNTGPTKFEIDEFYHDLEIKNFRVSDGELTQIFYDENTLIYQISGQPDTGVVKMNQGIFEIYKKSDGNYDTHGMITANTTLDILDGCNNFHDFAHITKGEWTYLEESNSYKLKVGLAYGILIYTGYFAQADKEYIDTVTLSKVQNHEYNIDVKYIESAKKSLGKVDYTIHYDRYRANVNEKLKNFIENTTVIPQMTWNSYQALALETYGFTDVPFLQSFTIGLKLHFTQIAGYASGGYACIVYDCMSNASKESNIASELLELGFTQRSTKSFYKATSTTGINLNIQFAFITHEEIEVMVEHGEATEGDLLAYPNGYMQLLYAYSFGEVETSISELNSTFTTSMLLPSLSEYSKISKLTEIDYKDAFNTAAVTDEEYIAMFKELGLEPGPIYDEIASIYFYIESEVDAVNYIDQYRELIEAGDYILNGEPGQSIKDMTGRCAEYYLNNDNDLPQYVLDIYLYDSSQSGDFEWNGVVEMVITKYTDLGLALFFAD